MYDIDYMDICRMLKRYSFEEKIKICNYYSRMVIDVNGDMNAQKIIDNIYPWELETFLLMSIKATPEYKEDNFEGKNRKKFVQMINGIRNYEHPFLSKMHGNINFVDYFLVTEGLKQFDIQEKKMYKMYRYSYIFNFCNEKINMREEFIKFFGTDYEDYLALGSYLQLLYGSDLILSKEVVEYVVYKKYPLAFDGLSISIEEYKEQLDKITTKMEDYITCLRPSYKYPFIIYNEHVYFPLPHLIVRAVTSSLLYRITEGNNSLRDKVGKEVLESYLLKILDESNVYDELYAEKVFEKERHNKARTLDVMARDGEDYIFLDSKAAVPLTGLRIFDKDSYIKETKRLAEKVVQVYNHLNNFLPKYNSYNPFKGKPQIDAVHKWGILVVLEDSYIRRSIIYQNAAEQLGISEESEEYEWMITHIKIASLFDIEKYAFIGKSLVEDLKIQLEQGAPGDYSFIKCSADNVCENNGDYKLFVEKIKNKYHEITNELFVQGILK